MLQTRVSVEFAAGLPFLVVRRENERAGHTVTFEAVWKAAMAISGQKELAARTPPRGKIVLEIDGGDALWVRTDRWRERHRLPFAVLHDLAAGHFDPDSGARDG